jgi:tetratricopeptide (TPR) repeat protein
MVTYSKQLIASGKAEEGDMNNAAWYALIRGMVTNDAIRLAQQSSQISRNTSPTTLHTLSALFAEIGEISQARDLLLRSLELRANEEPQSDDWYVLGRIAEQIGITEAALSAYNKVLKPKEDYLLADSTYALAQRRLAVLAK